jgi:hypothetical protein
MRFGTVNLSQEPDRCLNLLNTIINIFIWSPHKVNISYFIKSNSCPRKVKDGELNWAQNMTLWPTGKRAVSRDTQHNKHKSPISLRPLFLCYCLFNYACYKNEGYLTKQPRRSLLSLWCSHFNRPLSLLSLWCSARLLNPERMAFCTNQSTIVPPLTSFYRLLWQELWIKSMQHFQSYALWLV